MMITAYLRKNIDAHTTIQTCHKKNSFPVFLQNTYRFYEMTVLETRCILLEVLDDMPNIDQLKKHIRQIRNLTSHQIVLLYKDITRYRRKSLIENGIAFLVENGQMYLPFLCLDLQKAREQIKKEVKQFTTAAQVAYLYFLYHKDEIVNIASLTKKMGFSSMTASRALNELYRLNLITFEVGGKTERSKEYRRISDPNYFMIGREYLKSPVRKIVHTKNRPSGALTAGLDALSELSMINPPAHSVMALDRDKLDKEPIEIIENNDLIKDLRLVELQLWDYDPNLFSDKHHVDLVSLYASLQGEREERVEQALEEVLQGEIWYTD